MSASSYTLGPDFPGYDAVADTLHDLRVGAGLTQEELALKLGVTGPSVSHLETGRRRCSLELAFRWGAACGRPALLTFTKPDETP